jgi:mannose-6-phosphate isomerase-like protein (cupin superfamily)
MPKVSKDSTENVADYPVAEDRSSDLDGYTVNFVTIKESHSMAPMLASLPGGHCSCPHWGYLFSGRMVVQYGDHEEVIQAGDAYYLAPGHVGEVDAGTEFVMFSPAEELKATDAAIMAAMQA